MSARLRLSFSRVTASRASSSQPRLGASQQQGLGDPMIDPLTLSILTVVADVYVATNRTLPFWVVDALAAGIADPATPFGVAQRARWILREVDGTDCGAA